MQIDDTQAANSECRIPCQRFRHIRSLVAPVQQRPPPLTWITLYDLISCCGIYAGSWLCGFDDTTILCTCTKLMGTHEKSSNLKREYACRRFPVNLIDSTVHNRSVRICLTDITASVTVYRAVCLSFE